MRRERQQRQVAQVVLLIIMNLPPRREQTVLHADLPFVWLQHRQPAEMRGERVKRKERSKAEQNTAVRELP